MLYGLIRDTRTLSVIGMCKNAGKTTALNAIIAACDRNGVSLGLTSIGRDGERSDIVTNTKKPEIFVQSGTLVATAEMLLGECDISREILESTDIPSPLGDIVIVRAKSAGYVQIGGPSMTESLMTIRDELFALGCDKVLIDGAISRKSLGTPQLADGIILCSGASYKTDMRATAEDTAYIASLFSLPVYESKTVLSTEDKFTAVLADEAFGGSSLQGLTEQLKSGASALIVRGAVTDKTAAELLSSAKLLKHTLIVAEDSSRLLLGSTAYGKLIRLTGGFAVLKGAKLLAVTVNPFSAYGSHYDKDAFAMRTRDALLNAGLDLPVIDVTEV